LARGMEWSRSVPAPPPPPPPPPEPFLCCTCDGVVEDPIHWCGEALCGRPIHKGASCQRGCRLGRSGPVMYGGRCWDNHSPCREPPEGVAPLHRGNSGAFWEGSGMNDSVSDTPSAVGGGNGDGGGTGGGNFMGGKGDGGGRAWMDATHPAADGGKGGKGGTEQCDVCDREAQPQCVCTRCDERLCNECFRTCSRVSGCRLSFCARCQWEHRCDELRHG